MSVFPTGTNKETGGRKLEELTFEVCDSEGVGHVTKKARRFVERGVRRAFHVQVDGGAVYEWKRTKDAWVKLDEGAAITDRCFVVPIPVTMIKIRALQKSGDWEEYCGFHFHREHMRSYPKAA